MCINKRTKNKIGRYVEIVAAIGLIIGIFLHLREIVPVELKIPGIPEWLALFILATTFFIIVGNELQDKKEALLQFKYIKGYLFEIVAILYTAFAGVVIITNSKYQCWYVLLAIVSSYLLYVLSQRIK
jgi:hypothetical protein